MGLMITRMVRIDRQTAGSFFKSIGSLASGAGYGVLAGTLLALFLPTIFVAFAYSIQRVAAAYSGNISRSIRPWADTVVGPRHGMTIGFVSLLIVLALISENAFLALRRLYSAAATEATTLWAVSAYCICTEQRWHMRLFVSIATLLLTIAIASLRMLEFSVSTPLLNPDRPAQNASEDELERMRLVNSLVQRLLSDEIPVIALIGAYGDGKTSILNMLAEGLPKDSVALVRFKTSLPGDESTLVSTLFNSISKELHSRFFVRRLGFVLNRYARLLAGLFPALPSGLKEVFSAPSQEDELKELTNRFERLPIKRVIVLLDDMDRMQGTELQTLLKVVRGVEDYPKLSFVCAFNKNALVEILVRQQAVDSLSLNFSGEGATSFSGKLSGQISANDMRSGYEYLEKFFPVQIPVPKLDPKQIAKQFDIRFAEFTSHYGLLALPEEHQEFEKRFENLWRESFRPALSNVRKMKRYFNGLKASFGLVQGEVDLVDFMCIELLRQTEPILYDKIYEQRRFFYFPSWDIEHWDERLDSVDAAPGMKLHVETFNGIFGQLYGAQKDFVLGLIAAMFPKVSDYVDNDPIQLTPHGADEAEQRRRIYHPALFMVYFSLHVPEGYYSAQEFETMVRTVTQQDQEASEIYFRTYVKEMTSFKRMRFLERVIAVPERLNEPAARALTLALAHESNSLEADDFGIGDAGAARRLVFIIANRFNATDEISEILKEVIAVASSDGFAQRILFLSTVRDKNSIVQDWRNVDDGALKAAFASRMKRKYFKGGSLSIYDAPSSQDWQALISWYRINPVDVREYLADEFERRPRSIGKHLLWLWPSVTQSQESKRIVDDVFPLATLKELAKHFGASAYDPSKDSQRDVVERLLTDKFDEGWP